MVLYDFLFGEGWRGRGNNVHDAVGERRLNNVHYALGENGSTFNFLSIKNSYTLKVVSIKLAPLLDNVFSLK